MIGAVSAASDTSTEDIVKSDVTNNDVSHSNANVVDVAKTNNNANTNTKDTSVGTDVLKKTEKLKNQNTNQSNDQKTSTTNDNKLKNSNANEDLLKETTTTVNDWDELNTTITNMQEDEITIQLTDNEYNAKDTITINKKVTIDGNGNTINGQKQHQIFKVNGELILKNLKIINGKSDDDGGAIYNNGKLTIINCTFNNNTANWYGGAIFANSQTVNINNTTFTQNNANFGGAIFAATGSTVNINNTNFTKNTANNDGGAIFAATGSTVNINNTNLTENNATHTGGAILNEGTVIIMGSELTDNTATYTGGAIFNHAGTLTLVDSTLQNYGLSIFSSERPPCVVPIGGDIAFVTTQVFDISVLPAVDVDLVEIQLSNSDGYTGEVWVNVTNSTFNQIVKVNLKEGEGSGTINLPIGNKYQATINTIQGYDINPQTQEFTTIHETSFTALYSNITNLQDDTLSLTHDYIYDNRTDTNLKTGIPINKTITINGNGHTINGNNTARMFRVIDNGDLTLINITLTQGKGQKEYIEGQDDQRNVGGAIYANNTKITIINSTLTQNTAEMIGGAIYTNNSQLNITGNTITNNTARSGGAIYTEKSQLNIIGNTITNNTIKGIGGAINTHNSHVNITGNTITGNTATIGGAINTEKSQLNITGNTITNNNASTGGAIYAGSRSQVNITGNTITNNNASTGGAIYAGSRSQVNITGNTITGNNASDGGAIYTEYKSITSVISNLFMNNTASNNGSAIYGNNFDELTVNDNIFLNKTGSQIIYLKKYFDSVFGYDLGCNWFGNNASNYKDLIKDDIVGISGATLKFDNWLFLNATSPPNPISVLSTSNIIFKLSLYNNESKTESLYDNSLLYPVNLMINSGNGTVDKNSAHLNETIKYTATRTGIGSVTASIGSVSYTVELTNIGIPATVTVNNSTLDLFVDGTFTIVATTNPKDLDVTFVPDESGVYSIDEKGVVTALNEGTAKIIVKVGGDGIYRENSTTVTVTVSKIPTNIQVNNNQISLNVTDTTLSGATLNPADAGELTYTSNDTNVVTVDNTGKITATGQGYANITISYTGNNKYAAAENKTIYVTVNLKNANVTVNNSTLDLFVDDTFTIVATTNPKDLDVTFVPDESGVYSIDEKGVVTALNEGTAKIIVKVGGDGVYAENTTEVTVTVSKVPTEITVDTASLNLFVGDETVIIATLTPADAGNATFTSSNDSIVTVDNQGNVIAMGKGHANITVSFAGDNKYASAKNKTISIDVKLNDASVTVDKDTLNLKVGETYAINATKNPDTILIDITYKSSNDSIVTVDKNGIVTAVGEGTATITVKISGNGIYTENSTIVTVKVSKIPTPQPQPTPSPEPVSKQNTKILAKNKVYKPAKYKTYKVTVKNNKGKPVKNTKVKLKIGKKTYTAKTNKKGIATFKIPNKKTKKKSTKKSYKITATLNKNAKKDKLTLKMGSKKYNTQTNNNGKGTFKVKTNTKKIRKYTITLKTTTGQIVQKQKITLKVKGKTFKATTNNKGKATFKINNLNKNGKYKTKIQYKGNNQYNKSSKTVKITIKE